MTELRRRLREAGVEYVVIKNTLARARWPSTGSPGSGEQLGRPDRPGAGRKDPVAAAKVLTDFAKENEQARR